MLSPMRCCAALCAAGVLAACAGSAGPPAAASGARELDPSTAAGAGVAQASPDAATPAQASPGASNPAQGSRSDSHAGASADAGARLVEGRAAGEATAPPVSEPAAQPPTVPAGPADLPEKTRVLHVGDSFAGALGYELNRLLAEHEVRGFLKYEKSTYIPTWAWGKELPLLISRYRPDLVLITLGGNELQIPDPEQRAKTVQRLVKRLGDIPCVWVGIPVWEGADRTLMDVIERNVSPCLFYDSAKQLPDMARAGDGIHPSKSARTRWAEAFIEWLRRQVAPTAFEAWAWRTPPVQSE